VQVAVAIVVRPHIIDLDHDEGEGHTGVLRPPPLGRQTPEQRAPVGQAGRVVGQAQPAPARADERQGRAAHGGCNEGQRPPQRGELG
jgi:hypothetical protein